MRSPFGTTITIALILLLDSYLFLIIRSLMINNHSRIRIPFFSFFWVFTALTIAGLLLFLYTPPEWMGRTLRQYLFAMLVIVFFSKIISALFFVVDDLRRGVQWLIVKLFSIGKAGNESGAPVISRSVFLNWLGLAAGGSFLGTMLYGFSNKYNYQIKRVKLHFDNLPKGFVGMKMLQFSDVHSGSFHNKRSVERGVDMILNENADLVVFSGDLVNDMATEMRDYIDVFSRVKAPLGVYSTLGNHDYGDYVRWPINGISKEQNLINLKEIHGRMGWNLLNNEHAIIERNGDQFPLIGIENWSAVGHFPKYGDLKKAYEGTGSFPFKILISHDPSHWDAQVRPEYPDIDLMLSGHTHGFQFGVEIPGFKWSPVQYVYKEWDGLYEEGNQKLYVNPGYGFIGYPGRVGILPEITVFEFV